MPGAGVPGAIAQHYFPRPGRKAGQAISLIPRIEGPVGQGLRARLLGARQAALARRRSEFQREFPGISPRQRQAFPNYKSGQRGEISHAELAN